MTVEKSPATSPVTVSEALTENVTGAIRWGLAGGVMVNPGATPSIIRLDVCESELVAPGVGSNNVVVVRASPNEPLKVNEPIPT